MPHLPYILHHLVKAAFLDDVVVARLAAIDFLCLQTKLAHDLRDRSLLRDGCAGFANAQYALHRPHL